MRTYIYRTAPCKEQRFPSRIPKAQDWPNRQIIFRNPFSPMDGPAKASVADRYDVHLGTWTNWSRGAVFGVTLTMTQRDGALLIAFLAFFVTSAGTSFWKVCCFLLHLLRSSEVPSDALYHQQQVILRNSANAISGFTNVVQMAWAWRRHAQRPYWRILPLMLFAAACVASFAVASGFSSKISQAMGNEVLLSGTKCGLLDTDSDEAIP